MAWSALQCSPYLADGKNALRVFDLERKRNPKFNEDVNNALNFALGNLEREAMRRTMIPDTSEVRTSKPDGTEVVATSTRWDSANRLLQATLAKFSPAWIQKRQIDGNLTVTNNESEKQPSAKCFEIHAEDAALLSADQKRALMDIIRTIGQNRVGVIVDQDSADYIEGEVTESNQLPDQTQPQPQSQSEVANVN